MNTDRLEEQIEQWRSCLRRQQTDQAIDVAKLEHQLREEVAGLTRAGLDSDEAFLIAVKRMSTVDPRSREFAREHADRVWKQLIPSDSDARGASARKAAIVAFCLAVVAAVLVKVPALFGIPMDDPYAGFYIRNASLFVLPLLTGYFVWKRRLNAGTLRWLAVAFVAAGVVANIYPVAPEGYTEILVALHLPIALWLAVGIAYAGGRWRQVSSRMDFIRFSGELFIRYVLIALGGGVLTAFVALFFKILGMNPQQFIGTWLLPCGAAGAVMVASWLVEAKEGVIEKMAPVLTRLFTPMFAVMLVAFLGTLLWSGRGIAIERELLIGFDLLLVVVLGLLVYSISARDPQAPPGAFDVLQVVLVMSALVADAVALWSIAARINEFGFTPNRVAALGENVILLINLVWSAVLYFRFLIGRGSFSSLERWQTGYVPIYAGWAALVVILFPPLFRYI